MNVKKIVWGEHRPPSEFCHYDHVDGSHPLGNCRITWKSWKTYPTYDIDFDGDVYFPGHSTLEDAKAALQAHIDQIVLSCIE